MNTVLNDVYMRCCVVCFERLYGRNPVKDYQGTGDDVDMTLQSAEDGYKMYDIMLKMGYEDNEIKQLVTPHMHEFMRTIYTKNSVYTCINRALPAFICGDLERTGGDIEDKLKTGYINVAMLNRRGLSDDICRVLELCIINRYGRYKNTNTGNYEPISKHVLHAKVEQGGLGIPDSNNEFWVLEKNVPRSAIDQLRVKAVSYDMTRREVYNMINNMSRLGIDAEYNEERVKEMAVDSIDFSSMNRQLVSIMDSDDFEDYWRFECKVIAKEALSCEEDISTINMWIESLTCEDVDRSIRRITRFDQLCTGLPFTKLSKDEFSRILDGGQYDYITASDFSVDQRSANMVPEWVMSSVTMLCKHWLLNRAMTLDKAVMFSNNAMYTYMKVFGSNM